MTSITKPTQLPTWVPDDASVNLAVPPQALSDTGFQPNQPPAAQHVNWLLHNLGSWVTYLNESTNSTTLATTLDDSIRLLGGGTWSYSVASGALAWSAPFTLAIPSTGDGQNQAAAGQVTVPSGSIAYVTANLPFSTTADATSGSVTLANLGYEAGIVAGQTVTGPGIADGTTVKSIKGSTVTLSQAATQSAAQGSFTFVTSGPLTVKAAPSATFIPGPNTVLIARATDAACAIGVGATELWLRDMEQRSLVGAGYIATVSGPAGVALAPRQLAYLSFGLSDGRTAGSLYLADTGATQGASRGQPIGFCHTATAQGSTARVVNDGFLAGFSGLTPGYVYYADPATPGGITPTQPTTAGQVIAPVGIAVSATVLLVHISPARPVTSTLAALTVTGATTLNTLAVQSINNAAGFKSTLWMGTFWHTNAVASPQVLQTAVFNMNPGGVTGSMNRAVKAAFSGSVLSIQVRIYSTMSATLAFDIMRNNSQVIASTAFTIATTETGTYLNGKTTFTRGVQTFNVEDVLYVSLRNPPAGANIQIEADLIVDFQS